MDCGGVADKWEETVIQLWNPGDEPEREYLAVRKFLAIYERVAKHIPVSLNFGGRSSGDRTVLLELPRLQAQASGYNATTNLVFSEIRFQNLGNSEPLCDFINR